MPQATVLFHSNDNPSVTLRGTIFIPIKRSDCPLSANHPGREALLGATLFKILMTQTHCLTIPLGTKAFFLTKLVCAQRAPKKWNLSSQTRQVSSCCAVFVKDFSELSVKWGGKARNLLNLPEDLRSPNRGWNTTRKMRALPEALRPHTW